MSSNLSTESPAGNVGTGGTLKDLKTDFANLLINRVTLGECLNVIRDACVARASDLVDEADEPTLGSIRADVESFKSSPNTGSGGNVGTDPNVPVDSSGDAGDANVADPTGLRAKREAEGKESAPEESQRERIERRARERAAEREVPTGEAPTGHFVEAPTGHFTGSV